MTKSDLDVYDDFVKKHLQYYGYYSDLSYRNIPEIIPSSESESDNEEPINYFFNKIMPKPTEIPMADIKTTQVFYQEEDGKMVAKLKEPHQLYNHINWSSSSNPPRWPAGIQVIDEIVKHLDLRTTFPEPFYQQNGNELKPASLSCFGQGRVIFQYAPVVGPYFSGQTVKRGSSARSQVAVQLLSSDDETLIFESRFESGNLNKVVQIGPHDYELWLRADLYALKHTQWYYFRVCNTRANINYRFTIINFTKSDSLYNCGMKPLFYSEKNAKENQLGWIRVGSDIIYYKNSSTVENNYYSLTWTFEFPHDNDVTYFAYCYPYTYTDLQSYLANIIVNPRQSLYCRQRILCRSLAGNNVYTLSITAPVQNLEELKTRKSVIITCRVHPGETNSSWMMKGLLDFILDDNPTADLLRKNFLFRVIPMLNPDGVIVGNYRCSLSGRDLNRNYKTTMKDYFPCIWHTKNMIKKLAEEREVVLYCDLHGHSRRQDAFFYGCELKKPGQNFQERVFPYLMAQLGSDCINYKACRFKVQKEKESTGRVVVWNMGIKNSYTLEATFCGASFGLNSGNHYNQTDFEGIGRQLCESILAYCSLDPEKILPIHDEIKMKIKESILTHLNRRGASRNDADRSLTSIDIDKFNLSDVESSNSGSDSSLDDDVPIKRKSSHNKRKKKRRSLSQLDKQNNQSKIKSSAIEITNSKVEPVMDSNKTSGSSKIYRKNNEMTKNDEIKITVPPLFKKQNSTELKRVNGLSRYKLISKTLANENYLTMEKPLDIHNPSDFRYTYGEFVYGGYCKPIADNLTHKFSQMDTIDSFYKRRNSSFKVERLNEPEQKRITKKTTTNN